MPVARGGALDLAQRSSLGVEDEAANVIADRQLGTRSQPGETAAQGGLDIVERAEPPGWHDPIGGERLGELVLRRTMQTTTVVHNHHDLLSAELALGDGQ